MATLRFDDRASLRVITPVALSYYARAEGWNVAGTYRQHSDVYAGDGKPEIIVPRTDVIDDYAMAVSDLIAVFARVLERDEASIYRDLTLADRDVMRIRALNAEPDGLPFESGHAMLAGARGMLIAAAKSLDNNRLVYPSGTGGAVVADYLNRIHLGHTERGSFALVLVSPAIAPPLHPWLPDDDDASTLPERRVAQRLSQSLFAARAAAERAARGEGNAFSNEVGFQGVSANLCEAVADLVTGVAAFDVSFSWAMTRPAEARRGPVSFSYGDVPLLKEAARSFRSLEPEYDQRLHGFIERLARPQTDIDGTVTLKTSIGGRNRSVAAILNQTDYELAIAAHYSRAIVTLEGDLERRHLRNARLVAVVESPPLPGLETHGTLGIGGS